MVEQMVEQCTEMMRQMGDHMTDGQTMGTSMMSGMMNGGMMNGMMDGSMMSGMMGPTMLSMVLFWALLILGIVLLGRLLWRRTNGAPSGRSDALSILGERFARGEIDREEYQERRSVLQARR